MIKIASNSQQNFRCFRQENINLDDKTVLLNKESHYNINKTIYNNYNLYYPNIRTLLALAKCLSYPTMCT